MDKFIKLKAVALLVCSGITASAMADTATNNNDVNVQNDAAATQLAIPSDVKLSSDVNSALSEYVGKVNVSVKNADVFLEGELPSNTDYDNIVTLTESVKGVGDVNVDKLTVKGSNQPLQDSYITAKIKGTLIREDLMGKDIPSWSLHVETKNGQVFLSGTVLNEEQKQNILKVVKAVKGVEQVSDKTTLAGETTTATDTNDASSKPSDSNNDEHSTADTDRSDGSTH